jgi:hypothetical protein
MNELVVVLGIILGVIVGVLMIIGVGGSIKNNNRKKKCKDWKVGDKLILTRIGDYSSILTKNHKEFAILKGWSLTDLYIDCGGGSVYKVDWDVLRDNKSDLWRQNYEEAKKVMGVNPGFIGNIGDESETIGKKVDGKPIDTMNEIECEVYLKKALEEEDYDTAELIKKRMEKFR